MIMNDTALSVCGLTKKYRDFVLDEVTFRCSKRNDCWINWRKWSRKKYDSECNSWTNQAKILAQYLFFGNSENEITRFNSQQNWRCI